MTLLANTRMPTPLGVNNFVDGVILLSPYENFLQVSTVLNLPLVIFMIVDSIKCKFLAVAAVLGRQ